ncbi:MAG TPA: FAD-dependent oxidoreductase [Caulobacteraceae bacterium]
MPGSDFLVIGSGIAGASIAFELAAHARVIVAEQEERHGYHTTGRSAAMYIESYGAPAVRRLTVASRGFFDAPPAGFADYPLLDPRPCLTIATDDQSAELDDVAAQITATGSAWREVTGAEARGMVPALRAEAANRAILEPDSADIDVNALHQGFLRLARARGVEFRLDARVVALERVGDGWRASLAGGDTLVAAVLIDAAGAWADGVAALAGLGPLGLAPRRRTAILIDPPPGHDIARWPTVLDVAEQFYFKPQSGLILASPGDATPSPAVDAAPEEIDIAVCVARVQAAANIPVHRVARAWAGLRTFAPDSIPVIGYDPRTDGFFWFAGQGGYGMQTAPAAARLGAALALRRGAPTELADRGVNAEEFSPARFA